MRKLKWVILLTAVSASCMDMSRGKSQILILSDQIHGILFLERLFFKVWYFQIQNLNVCIK